MMEMASGGNKTTQRESPTCTPSLHEFVTVVPENGADAYAWKKPLDLKKVQVVKLSDTLQAEEKWSKLRMRIEILFSNRNEDGQQNRHNLHPLREHFKAALRREGVRYGQVPMCAIAILDEKIQKLCKAIYQRAVGHPVYQIALVYEAATQCEFIKIDDENLCLSRSDASPTHLMRNLLLAEQCYEKFQPTEKPDFHFSAVLIPSDVRIRVTGLHLTVNRDEYFLDVIARELGLKDSGRILFSREIPKTSQFTRMYWVAPQIFPRVERDDSGFVNFGEEETCGSESPNEILVEDTGSIYYSAPLNRRAGLLVDFSVYGNVILAAVGGNWSSRGNVSSSSISPSTFYQMLLQKFPQGDYKVSRGSSISKLPSVFSSTPLWRGKSPKRLLTAVCQEHGVPPPVFTLSTMPTDEESKGAQLHSGPFKFKVRVQLPKRSVIVFESDRDYSNRNEAQHSAALKALHFGSLIDSGFERRMIKLFEPNRLPNPDSNVDQIIKYYDPDSSNAISTGKRSESEEDFEFFNSHTVEIGSQYGKTPPPESMVTIRYAVRWVKDISQPLDSFLLERIDNFEFQLGGGGVLQIIDSAASRMSVGETCSITSSTPPSGLFNVSDPVSATNFVLFQSDFGVTKYNFQLVKYGEQKPKRRFRKVHEVDSGKENTKMPPTKRRQRRRLELLLKD